MKKNFLGKKWFFEDFLDIESSYSTWGFEIKKELFSGQSKFQKIEVFDTQDFGRVLVLDGIVQLSVKNEFVYHEMLVHPAMFYHPNPKKVLIIGGGDGMALREVLKHRVDEVVLVDIDKEVIQVSKKYFAKQIQGAFSDKRVKVFNEDVLSFIKQYKKHFDIIIVDLTDPTPVAKFCWNKKFYQDVSNALKDDGVSGFQSGSLNEPFSKKVRRDLSKTFNYFKTHRAFIECFPFSEYAFSFGSKKINLDKISIKKSKINLKYYSPEIHFVSSVMPISEL